MFSFDTLYSVFPFSFELISRSCWWHSAPYNWLQSAEVNLHRLNGVTLAIDEDERLHRSIPNSLVSFRQQAFSWFHPLLKISHPSEASVQKTQRCLSKSMFSLLSRRMLTNSRQRLWKLLKRARLKNNKYFYFTVLKIYWSSKNLL